MDEGFFRFGARFRQVWADLPLRSKGLVVVAIPLLPLLVTAGALYWGNGRIARADSAETRTLEVTDRLSDVLAQLGDAEAGVRSYLLTGRRDRLAPYDAAQQRVPQLLARLDVLAAEDEVSHALPAGAVDELRALSGRWLDALGELVRVGAPASFPLPQADLTLLDRSKVLTTRLHDAIGGMQRQEQRARAQAAADARAARRNTFVITVTGVSFGFGGGLLAMLLFTSGISTRLARKAEAAERLARGEPLPVIAPARDEIGRLGQRLRAAAALLQAREEARQLAHEELDQFFTLSPVMLCIARTDGYFARVNPSWTAHLGWSAEELLAVPYVERAHPADRGAFGREVTQLLRGASVPAYEGRYASRDGTYRLLRWTAVHHAARGLIYGVVRDVTERRRAEQALRESEARLHAILDNSPAAIYLKDPDGRFLLVNRTLEQLFGRTNAELQGLTDAALHTPDEAARIRADDLAVLGARRAVEAEERVCVGGGERVYMSIKFPIDDGTGAPQALCGISIDITDRTHAEAAVRQLNAALEQRMAELSAANQELEAFSYSVSHDLRAPLRHVAGFAALLERTSAGRLDEQGQRYVRTIAEAAARMGALIDDLLVFSRMGRLELRRTVVPVREVVDEVIAEIRSDCTGRAVDWIIQPLPAVYADRAMLRQALMNLVANAVKYTATRPLATIEIGARPDGPGTAALYVRDNGVGFDMQYADKLFGVFQRLHAADQFEGTGIGLANVRRIVQRHGGRTWAEGVVDGGATFWLTMPSAE
ncbi:MAG TPA: PAS domain S-box protein [Vicinamibacterales bacterium]|nr:PAS domain S-box protein [Vicinamibacterales bacterium]